MLITISELYLFGVYAGALHPEIDSIRSPIDSQLPFAAYLSLETYQTPVTVSMATMLPFAPGLNVGGPTVWLIPPDCQMLFVCADRLHTKSARSAEKSIVFMLL